MSNHVVVDGLGNVAVVNPTVQNILEVVNKALEIAEMVAKFTPGTAGEKFKSIVAVAKDIVAKATPFLQSELVGKIIDIVVALLDKTKAERAVLASQFKALLG